jgi:hypothetical protein
LLHIKQKFAEVDEKTRGVFQEEMEAQWQSMMPCMMQSWKAWYENNQQ